MSKLLYICGPMSGMPDLNRPAFRQAAHQLRQAGYRVINPAEMESARNTSQPESDHWLTCIIDDLALIQKERPDGLALLRGAGMSKGCEIEMIVAARLGMRIVGVGRWLKEAGQVVA